MTNRDGPLRGVKVVACSTAQAGTVPYMLMDDLGAQVIKIEVTEGARRAGSLPRLRRARGPPEVVLRDQQPRREQRHAQSQDRRGAGDSAQARCPGGYLRPELPPGRRGQDRLWLRGAEEDQPEAR